jgi:hypothetical protein
MEVEIGNDGAMKWQFVTPPIWWPAANGWVVADRHLPNGRRQHMLRGSAPPGHVVSNADVIGQDDVPQAEYASMPSHLSTQE